MWNNFEHWKRDTYGIKSSSMCVNCTLCCYTCFKPNYDCFITEISDISNSFNLF